MGWAGSKAEGKRKQAPGACARKRGVETSGEEQRFLFKRAINAGDKICVKKSRAMVGSESCLKA